MVWVASFLASCSGTTATNPSNANGGSSAGAVTTGGTTSGTAGANPTGGSAQGQGGGGGDAGVAGSAGSAGSSGGAGASGGVGAVGGIGGDAGASAIGGAGGEAGSTGCPETCEQEGFTCCGDQCVNPYNDHHNCGQCGNACDAGSPSCTNGRCAPPDCQNTVCIGTAYCCGDTCCEIGSVCCAVPGPVAASYSCIPQGETCPLGCLLCRCAAPETSIATPIGERSIFEIHVGDLVYSVHRGRLVVVPVREVRRVSVRQHRMLSLVLESGAKLEMSPKHPTADGRLFSELRRGDLLDGLRIVSIHLVDYEQEYTHDILPQSDTGAYFAAGALVGSTLATAPARIANSNVLGLHSLDRQSFSPEGSVATISP